MNQKKHWEKIYKSKAPNEIDSEEKSTVFCRIWIKWHLDKMVKEGMITLEKVNVIMCRANRKCGE